MSLDEFKDFVVDCELEVRPRRVPGGGMGRTHPPGSCERGASAHSARPIPGRGDHSPTLGLSSGP
eukprot:1593821-Prymnesium_polylepis.2